MRITLVVLPVVCVPFMTDDRLSFFLSCFPHLSTVINTGQEPTRDALRAHRERHQEHQRKGEEPEGKEHRTILQVSFAPLSFEAAQGRVCCSTRVW